MLSSLCFVLFALCLPIAVPLGIIAIIIHFVNKADERRRLSQANQQHAMSEIHSDGSEGFVEYDVPGIETPETVPERHSEESEPKEDIPEYEETPVHEYSAPAPAMPKKERQKLSSSVVLLLIGTAFIVLSGIAFAAANWVNTTPMQRSFIMLAAAAAAFVVSIVLRSAAKLDNTSAAAYTVGTIFSAITLITAGYYQLFGSWLSIPGDGSSLLMAISCGVVAAMTLTAGRLYKKEAFDYVGLSAISVGLLFIALQATSTFRQFAAAVIVLQAIITAAIHIFNADRYVATPKAARAIGNFSSVVYALLAFIYTISHSDNADASVYIIDLVIIAQLIFYGIFRKKQHLIVLQSLACLHLAFVAAYNIADSFEICFAYFALAVYLANRFIPALRTQATEIITMIGLIIGSLASVGTMKYETILPAIAVPVICTVIINIYTLSKNPAVSSSVGIVAPLLPIFIAIRLDTIINDYRGAVSRNDIECVNTIVFGSLVMLLTLMTALMIYMPKIAFSFHAKHPRQSDTVLYANMTVSAIMMLFFSHYSSLFAVTIAVAAFHFFISNQLKNNLPSLGSVVSLLMLTQGTVRHFAAGNNDMTLYIMLGVFVLLIGISRAFFRDALFVKNGNKVTLDVIQLTSWIVMFLIPMGSDATDFTILMMIAVYIANFVRRNTKPGTARVILTASAAMAAFAFIIRPFFIVKSEIISSKITLAILVLLGICYRFIWRADQKASRIASNIVFIAAFTGLIIDAMRFHQSGNTIFVMAVTTVVLISAFMARSKTWFSVSSIALIIITLWSSWKYLSSLSWWVYLFIVGIVLIAVAAMNEYYKTKGENVKSKFAKVFTDWKW